MTIIKQTSVNGKSHQKNLRSYINDDRKVLLRDCQNMEGCTDIKRWAYFMDRTREAFGHNTASRRVRDKKTGELVQAKNTLMYHQILAFLPDECDINGGKLTPEDCMRYAKEYAAAYYPNQQVVFALHNEYCKSDKTHRYAIHMVINRSDLVTGKRLNEGRGQSAKVMRAGRIRSMDRKWGLHEVVSGEGNSSVHKRQPGKAETEIEARGGQSYKMNLRELCQLAAERVEDIYSYRELLEGWGVATEFRNGRMYATDMDNSRYSFLVSRLDADLSSKGLESAFRSNIKTNLDREGTAILARRDDEAAKREQIWQVKAAYLSDIEKAYLAYRKSAHELKGTPLEEFPRFRLSRPPKEVAKDPEVRRTILAYWRGADELRVKMATDVPYMRGAGKGTQTRVEDVTRNDERHGGGRGIPEQDR